MAIGQQSNSPGSPPLRLDEARKQIRIVRDQLDDSDFRELEHALELIEDVQTDAQLMANDD